MPILKILLNVSLVIFMAGNLLGMGLRPEPRDALRGLHNGHEWPAVASRLQPLVKRTTGVATVVMLGLCAVVYGKGFIGAAFVPLFSAAETDQQAVVMVALGLLMQILCSFVAASFYARRAALHLPVAIAHGSSR